LASQLLRSAQHRRCPCRSRLAGEEARETCVTWAGTFAGKPAPTGPPSVGAGWWGGVIRRLGRWNR
ncbi:hypothetical protein CW358_14790, partial [Pseudomonas protegens]